MTDARLILDLLPKPVALLDASLVAHDANRAFVTRFGMARPVPDSGARQAFWDQLASAVARMQPEGRLGAFRWTDAGAGDTLLDVHITRVGDDRFLLVADDVSAYVAVENIQQGVRDYVESVLNHLDHGVVVLDRDLRVTFFNAAQAGLWERAGLQASLLDVVGTPIARAYPVFDEPQWAAIGAEVREGHSVVRGGVAWAGSGRALEVVVRPLQARGGETSGLICVSREASTTDSLRDLP